MNSEQPVASRASRVRPLAQIEEAARMIGPLWPLSTFVAVNPLWDLRHVPFHDAVEHAVQVLGIGGYPSPALFAGAYADRRVTGADLRAVLDGRVASGRCTSTSTSTSPEPEGGPGAQRGRVRTAAERHDDLFRTQIAATVDREVVKWCAAYVAGIPADEPARGFYAAWCHVVVCDPTARVMAGRAGRKRLAEMGADPEDAILACIELLDIADDERVPELARRLARMPGWAGHAEWRSRWAAPGHPGAALHPVDYLAVSLCYEAVLLRATPDGDLWRRAQNYDGCPGGSKSTNHASKGNGARPGRLAVGRLPDDVEESDGWKIRQADGSWECWTPAAARAKEASAHG